MQIIRKINKKDDRKFLFESMFKNDDVKFLMHFYFTIYNEAIQNVQEKTLF